MKTKISLVTLAVFSCLLFSLSRLSASDDKPSDKRTITIQGQGKVRSIPDIAVLSVEVRKEGSALDPVAEQVRKGIGKVFDALKAQGVAEKDIQTTAYQVQPRYEHDRAGNSRPNGYIVLDRVSAKVRDMKKVGKTLSAVVEAEATSVQGPDFDIDNPQELERKALTLAMEDAHAKAAILASSAGAKLGPVFSVRQEGGIAWPAPRPMMARMGAMAAMAAPEPIAAGEQEISATVQVTYELQ